MLNNLLLRKVKDSDFKNIAKLFNLIFKKKYPKNFITGDILIKHILHS